eukprot:153420-Amphidinium_carterae.1
MRRFLLELMLCEALIGTRCSTKLIKIRMVRCHGKSSAVWCVSGPLQFARLFITSQTRDKEVEELPVK